MPRRPYRTSPIKRVRRTKSDISAIQTAIYLTCNEDHPQSVRGVFYQLVTQGRVPKTEAGYRVVQRECLKMRRSGALPYDWIADGTRLQRKPQAYVGLHDFYFQAAQMYRRDLWSGQGCHIEIWCEKDALSGVLYPETSAWDVPLMVARGFSSESFLYATAEAIREQQKPAFIYHLGDRDPSGVLIDKAIESGLRRLAPDAEIYFERLAVTTAQITVWDLPTRPTKRQGNTHAHGFEGESVELDAIPARQMRELVRNAILRHVDADALQACEVAEQSEHTILRQLAGANLTRKYGPRRAKSFVKIIREEQDQLRQRRGVAHP